ncbi:hypothetical protein SS50377_23070 [Spironucleus salmonicida]|uniref:Uncharacterized protein n=1 Tax=Spironucleus salmonicida TaxID=348837 RepID=V6LSK1_9EUKA|nr:hypothetical protein SS50377_23070 [Spironucleus salmonicida]|eukprot:EST47647.1 Hypothetical protein SS50377_12342 [Spironucleus salmonicida]
MNGIIKQLQLLNEAIYSNMPLPSTTQLTQLVLDQLIKNNILLLEVFQSAPLLLLGLSGKNSIQLQIFKNGYKNRQWLSIFDPSSIQTLLFKGINHCTFKIQTESDKIEKKFLVQQLFAIFGMEVDSYEIFVNYILESLVYLIQGTFQCNFSQITNILKVGEVVNYSSSFNKLLDTIFSILSPVAQQKLAVTFLEITPNFSQFDNIVQTLQVVTKFTQLNAFQNYQQRIPELLQTLSANINTVDTPRILEHIYSPQIISLSKKLIRQGSFDFEQICQKLIIQLKEVINYAIYSQNSLYSLKMPLKIQEINYHIIRSQLQFLINSSQIMFGNYVPPFYMATNMIVNMINQNQFLKLKFNDIISSYKNQMPNQFFYGNITLEQVISIGGIKTTDQKLDSFEMLQKAQIQPQVQVQQLFKSSIANISNVNITKVEPQQKITEDSTVILGLTSFADDSLLSEIIAQKQQIPNTKNLEVTDESGKLEISKYYNESIIGEESKIDLDLKFL